MIKPFNVHSKIHHAIVEALKTNVVCMFECSLQIVQLQV